MRLFLTVFCWLSLLNSAVYAAAEATKRVPQFSNDKVSVWKTIVYPGMSKTLKMHRHEHDRVVVALTDGELKITNDKGKVHYLKLEKDKAYYLTKDVPGELHSDQNMTDHAVAVMVVELQ